MSLLLVCLSMDFRVYLSTEVTNQVEMLSLSRLLKDKQQLRIRTRHSIHCVCFQKALLPMETIFSSLGEEHFSPWELSLQSIWDSIQESLLSYIHTRSWTSGMRRFSHALLWPSSMQNSPYYLHLPLISTCLSRRHIGPQTTSHGRSMQNVWEMLWPCMEDSK